MNRKRALKVVMVLVGLFFVALIYPLTMFLWSEAALAMMLSLYVTLGIFLLIAARNPWANRSLIAFTAWSSLAHAAVMAGQGPPGVDERGDPLGGGARGVFICVGVVPPGPGGEASERGAGARGGGRPLGGL